MRGDDGGQHSKDRKRHLAVDALGLGMGVVVHAANIQDKVGLRLVLRRVPLFERWQRVLVDADYDTDANRHGVNDWFGGEYIVSPRAVDKGCTHNPAAGSLSVLLRGWVSIVAAVKIMKPRHKRLKPVSMP